MTLYQLLLIVPALLVIIALGMVILAFFQYRPEEILQTVVAWLKAHAVMLAIYGGVLVMIGIFLL
jgi:flagellar biosynthesis component FlhA